MCSDPNASLPAVANPTNNYGYGDTRHAPTTTSDINNGYAAQGRALVAKAYNPDGTRGYQPLKDDAASIAARDAVAGQIRQARGNSMGDSFLGSAFNSTNSFLGGL
jgi:hypothetical protein